MTRLTRLGAGDGRLLVGGGLSGDHFADSSICCLDEQFLILREGEVPKNLMQTQHELFIIWDAKIFNK